MMLILPVIFSMLYFAFFGFILGDWNWVVHAMDWPGTAGICWRAIHATIFGLGFLASFGVGVMAHD